MVRLFKPKQTQLRRHFVLWIKRVLLPNWVPNSEGNEWQALNDLSEVHNMLAERARRWPEQWKQQGLEEGRQEGETKTRVETARNMLERTPMDDQMIAELSGLDVEHVHKLRDELKH